MYRYRVTFHRRFLSGLLAGVTIAQALPFATAEGAASWIASVTGRPLQGATGASVIESATVEPIA